MSLFKQMAKVRAAQLEMTQARSELSAPASKLLVRGQHYPLTTVGAAAGAGFVLGHLNVHPLRVPGLGSLLSGGLAETVAYGARLVSELGALRSSGADADTDASGDTAAADSGSGPSA